MNQAKQIITELLALAGVTINGSNPWDIQIHNESFYNYLIANPEFNIGETYVAGWWDCPRLDEFFGKVFRADLENILKNDKRFLRGILYTRWKNFLSQLINYQSKRRSLTVGLKHYDLGNDFFQLMLDPLMNYSCGYWHNSHDLASAQKAKLDLVCRKLGLKPGMKVLDIGCGWGSFAKYAAENYQVSVFGVTVSKQQYEFASQHCQGLPIEIKFQDYRDITGEYDRISSIGMFEHVGYKNYRRYMQTAHRCLKNNGLFLLHTIGNDTSITRTNAWINKYIFPNGSLPSIAQIGTSIEKLFIMEDWHNFGADYDKTLLAWQQNLIPHWDKLKEKYGDKFYRMWNFYLLSCAGVFRARAMELWQIMLAKNGVAGGYTSVR